MEIHYGHWHLGRYARVEIGRYGVYAARLGVEIWYRQRTGPHRVYCLYLGGWKTMGKAHWFSYVGGLTDVRQPNPHRRY